MSLLQIKDISMSFGSVKALDGVNLEIDEGTVLGLVGDNGAGKSTLIKILSGVFPPSSGEVFVDNKKVNFGTPKNASDTGIGTVYQDLALNALTSVTRNFFLGREMTYGPRPFGFLKMKEMHKIAIERVEKQDKICAIVHSLWLDTICCQPQFERV